MREVEELVVLLAPDGTPSGQAPKATVHHASTPLHLAFSCWVFDREGRVLLTQRAAGKATWPLVWTNTFCGHPAPEEDPAGAVLRRAGQELGLGLRDLQLVLPDFRYTATMDNGLVENEVCPVYAATATGEPVPDPAEVADLRWVAWEDLPELVARQPARYSPWMRLQLPLLAGHRPGHAQQQRR